MLLTVDIGNTQISLGGYVKTELRFQANLTASTKLTADQYAIKLQNVMKLHKIEPSCVSGAIICCVVPELSQTFTLAIYSAFKIKPVLVGPGIKTGLNILIDNPAQLGANLVASAVAAGTLYPCPCIIFDLDTAMTVSVLNSKGDFVGCTICAGIGLTLDSLTNRTALLPHVSIEKPNCVIGTNTVSSMQSGLIYGTAAMMDGLAQRIEEELQQPAFLIVTGRHCHAVVSACRRKFTICDNLFLEGLRIIYEKNTFKRGKKHE